MQYQHTDKVAADLPINDILDSNPTISRPIQLISAGEVEKPMVYTPRATVRVFVVLCLSSNKIVCFIIITIPGVRDVVGTEPPVYILF
jgi:hypothetical protein